MHIIGIRRGLITACLLALLGSAQAAGGISVTQQEARRITTGMSSDEVQRLLGRPASDVQYRNEPGPIWLYHVTDAIDPVFLEISFDRDGKVANISQYVDPRAYTGK
jgi:outer membrane protein assembly factor BamE (lipoprotein component of BamABCDE complex)